MVYFCSEEIEALKKMIDDCYDCDCDYEMPPEYTELLGVLNFKIECGRIKDAAYSQTSKEGVAE